MRTYSCKCGHMRAHGTYPPPCCHACHICKTTWGGRTPEPHKFEKQHTFCPCAQTLPPEEVTLHHPDICAHCHRTRLELPPT